MKDGEGLGTSVYYIEGDPVVYTEDGLEAFSDVGMRDSDDLDEVAALSEILSLYLD